MISVCLQLEVLFYKATSGGVHVFDTQIKVEVLKITAPLRGASTPVKLLLLHFFSSSQSKAISM